MTDLNDLIRRAAGKPSTEPAPDNTTNDNTPNADNDDQED